MLRFSCLPVARRRRSGDLALSLVAGAGLILAGCGAALAQYGAPGYQAPPSNLSGVPVYEDSASYPQPESQPVAPPPGSGWGQEGGYNPTPGEVMAQDRGPVNAQIAGMMEYTAPDQVLSVRIPSGSAMTVRVGAIQNDGCRGFTYNYNGLDGRAVTVSGQRCRTPAGDWLGTRPDRVLSGATAQAPAPQPKTATVAPANIAPGAMPQPVARSAAPAAAATPAPSAIVAPPATAAATATATAPAAGAAAGSPRVVLANPSAPLPPEEDAAGTTAAAAAGDSAVVGLLTRLGYLADASSPDKAAVEKAIAEFEQDEGIGSPMSVDALRTRLATAAGRLASLPRCASPVESGATRYGVCVGSD